MTSITRALLIFLLLIIPTLGHAAESAPHATSRLVASLVTDTDNPAPGQAFRLGLRLRLTPGWHTYWKNPGDAGVPAEFLPAGGVAAASLGDIAWPAPSIVREGPLVTYAYEHDVLLTRTATRSAEGGPITAHAFWLVCEKICVPEEADFSIAPGTGDAASSPESALFAAADAAVPRPSPWAATVSPAGTLGVAGPGLDPSAVASALFIPDDAAMAASGAPPALRIGADGLTGQLKPGTRRASGILRVVDRGGATSDFSLAAAPGPALALHTSGPELPRVLLLALGGGLLLNLMPCVFPVLAMKAVSFASSAGRGKVRGDALAYSAGVMVTFAALGGLLLAVRAGGTLDGWGFQFQSPAFVTAMAWLLFAVGLNLSGVFEVGGRVAGAGQSLAARGGRAGSFFTGLLAVLVATPCTAPFMGVAVAFALAAPPATAMLVFLALGAGLAGPTLLLACVPGLARAMPRPGAWMVVLKQALAFPMYAAAVWLVWVVSQEAGSAGVLAAGAGLVLVGLAAWAWGLPYRRWPRAVAIVACLAAVGVLIGAPMTPEPAVASEETFSAQKLADLRATGKTVFVNLTAAWCVTCLVNERVALAPDAVRAAFATGHVAYLKGDWTRRDVEVTRFLRAQGRDGVPLYAVYRPGAAEPEILPQILTERIVLDAIRPAG